MASTVSRLFKEVEALRVELGVSIDEVAEYIDVTPLAYSRWKRNKLRPGATNPSAQQEDGLNLVKRMLEYAKHSEQLPVVETNPRLAKAIRLDVLRRIRHSV